LKWFDAYNIYHDLFFVTRNTAVGYPQFTCIAILKQPFLYKEKIVTGIQ